MTTRLNTTEHVDIVIDSAKQEIVFKVKFQDIDCGFMALHNAFFEVIQRHYADTIQGAKTLSSAIAMIQKSRGIVNMGKQFSDNKQEMN